MQTNKSTLADAADGAYEVSHQDELFFNKYSESIPLDTTMISDAFENNDFWFVSTDGPSTRGSSINNEYTGSEPSFTHDDPRVNPPSSVYHEDHQTDSRLLQWSSTAINGGLPFPAPYSTSQLFFSHGMMPTTHMPTTHSRTLEEKAAMPTPLRAPPGAPEGFVNAYVRVDPTQNTVTLPQQTLHYQNETCAVIDEALLPTFSASDMDGFHRQFLHQQMQVTSYQYQQQQHHEQPLFSRVAPALHSHPTFFPNYSCLNASSLPAMMHTTPPAAAPASLVNMIAQHGKPNGVRPAIPIQTMVHHVLHPNIQVSAPMSDDTTSSDFSLLSNSKAALTLIDTPVKKATPTRTTKMPKKASRDKSLEPSLPPARHFSAYNFFFRYERERILKYGCDEEPQSLPLDHYDHYQWTPSNSLPFQRDVLLQHWARDRTIKRKHRKSHGRISFKTLTKRISASWHALPEPAKDVFREIAARDFQRYTQEVTQAAIAKSLPSSTC